MSQNTKKFTQSPLPAPPVLGHLEIAIHELVRSGSGFDFYSDNSYLLLIGDDTPLSFGVSSLRRKNLSIFKTCAKVCQNGKTR